MYKSNGNNKNNYTTNVSTNSLSFSKSVNLMLKELHCDCTHWHTTY